MGAILDGVCPLVNVIGGALKQIIVSYNRTTTHASGTLVPCFSQVSLQCRSSLRSRPCCSSRALPLRRSITLLVLATQYGTGYVARDVWLSSDLYDIRQLTGLFVCLDVQLDQSKSLSSRRI